MEANPQEKLYDVFISYSPIDTAWVEKELLPRLKKARLSVFIDSKNIKPGDQRWEALNIGMRKSRSILLVLSNSYVENNEKMDEEMNLVRRLSTGKEAILIPVSIDKKTLPLWLSQIHIINFVDYQSLEFEKQEKLWNDVISAIRKARQM